MPPLRNTSVVVHHLGLLFEPQNIHPRPSHHEYLFRWQTCNLWSPQPTYPIDIPASIGETVNSWGNPSHACKEVIRSVNVQLILFCPSVLHAAAMPLRLKATEPNQPSTCMLYSNLTPTETSFKCYILTKTKDKKKRKKRRYTISLNEETKYIISC